MGFYDLYKTRIKCSTSESTLKQEDIEQEIKDNFEAQPNYHLVYLNDDLVTTYKVLISQGNIKDKTDGHKILTSYPYDTFVFDTGDYVTWTYGKVTSKWLITTMDKTYLYDAKGRIERCNNDLKWIDVNGEIKSYECVIMDTIKEDGIKHAKFLSVPDGYIIVQVQEDSNTSLITENQRFLFNGKAFKVRSVLNFIDDNLLTFTMEKDLVNEEVDDIVNNIADANSYDYQLVINETAFEQIVGYTGTLTYSLTLDSEESTRDVEWVSSDDLIATIDDDGNIELLAEGTVTFTVRMTNNTDVNDTIEVISMNTLRGNFIPSGSDRLVDVDGKIFKILAISNQTNRIEPNVTNILQEDTQTYTVYKYVDNVANSDTFAITGSGASTSYYTLTTTDNGFSVTSLGYTSTPLVITCTNDNDATTTSITINLKGLW